MAVFILAYDRLMKWEGGYQANPNDPGNRNSRGELVGTNYGINAKVYEKIVGRVPSVKDMQNMPESVAKKYYMLKWEEIKGDVIPEQPVADILFDGIINHNRGVQLAQEVLGVIPDNIFGDKTLNALLNTDPVQFYNKYRELRRTYYNSLISKTPSLSVFWKGWMNRLDSFNDYGTSGFEVVVKRDFPTKLIFISTGLLLGAMLLLRKNRKG
jgi:lysozyme family protein